MFVLCPIEQNIHFSKDKYICAYVKVLDQRANSLQRQRLRPPGFKLREHLCLQPGVGAQVGDANTLFLAQFMHDVVHLVLTFDQSHHPSEKRLQIDKIPLDFMYSVLYNCLVTEKLSVRTLSLFAIIQISDQIASGFSQNVQQSDTFVKIA